MKIKRKLDIVVISDVHLGAKATDAKKLLNYLNSIVPKHLVLNGDIIDFSKFNNKPFPKSHLKVIKKFMKFSSNGTKITYIVGKRDKYLEEFVGKQVGNISIVNKLLLNLDGRTTWFLTDLIFESSLKYAKWVSKFGSFSYKLLSIINILSHRFLKVFRKNQQIELEDSNTLNSHIEEIINKHATTKGYDYVISKLTKTPGIVNKNTDKNPVYHMNAGNWSQDFTALEYRLKRWKLYKYVEDKLIPFVPDEDLDGIYVKDLIAAITIVKLPDEEE